MQPAQNVDLAKHLALPPAAVPQEAAFRGACGRAYYAAFITARDEMIRLRKITNPRADVHSAVIQLLKSSKTVVVQGLGIALEQLKVTRHSADYELGALPIRGQPFDARRASVAIARAEEFLAIFEKERASDPSLGLR
jgi:uncharacterized protein (UPF0332 family)